MELIISWIDWETLALLMGMVSEARRCYFSSQTKLLTKYSDTDILQF